MNGHAGPPILKVATPPAWAVAAARDPSALLADHAHCELKAAANAMTLLKRNPDRPGLALRLAPLIKEETDHLHRVLRALDERGAGLAHDAPSPYAEGLHRSARASAPPGTGLLDVLVVSALIEARSHERFLCLLACPELADLHPLYAGLAEAERRHGGLFAGLAAEVGGADRAAARLDALAEVEAGLLGSLPFAPRVHSGWADLPGASPAAG